MQFLRYFIVIVILNIFVLHESQALFKVQNCEPEVFETIKEAINFVSDHVDDLNNTDDAYTTTDILIDGADTFNADYIIRGAEKNSFKVEFTQQEIARIKDVLFKKEVAVMCVDSKDPICLGSPATGLSTKDPILKWIVNHGNENAIRLCPEMQNFHELRCSFYNSMAHEIAHVAKLPARLGHNLIWLLEPGEEKSAFAKRDKVYQVGMAIGNKCRRKVGFSNLVRHENSDGSVYWAPKD